MAEQKNTEATLFLNEASLLEKHGLPYSYLYTFVLVDEPTTIVGFGSGHTFRTEDNPTIRPNLTHYRVTYLDDQQSGLYTDTDERAILMLEQMFGEDLVKRMEKEQLLRSIVWPSRA